MVDCFVSWAWIKQKIDLAMAKQQSTDLRNGWMENRMFLEYYNRSFVYWRVLYG